VEEMCEVEKEKNREKIAYEEGAPEQKSLKLKIKEVFLPTKDL
jgi:hypothetical protein